MGNYHNNKQDSALFGGNAAFVEECYELYLQDPTQVSEAWRRYFGRLDTASDGAHTAAVSAADIGKQRIVDRMITQYRYQGARVSQINPLEYDKAEAEIINRGRTALMIPTWRVNLSPILPAWGTPDCPTS